MNLADLQTPLASKPSLRDRLMPAIEAAAKAPRG